MGNLSLKWTDIDKILNGLIGKAFLLVSIAIPISKLIPIGINFIYYPYTLLGALLVLISYLLSIIFGPDIIFLYKSPIDYASNMLKLQKDKVLDFYGEFEMIEDHLDDISNYIDYNPDSFKKFFPIKNAILALDIESAVYKLSKAKFAITNKKNETIRQIISILLCGSFGLLYFPVLIAIVNVFFQ